MTHSADITRERTKSFLQECIRSLDDLRVLLHLRADRGQMQGIEPIACATQLDGETILGSVQRLAACELLEPRGCGATATYAYAPSSPELDTNVNDLARLYEHCRFDVVSWLMVHAIERIRRDASTTFANIVRARRGDGS